MELSEVQNQEYSSHSLYLDVMELKLYIVCPCALLLISQS